MVPEKIKIVNAQIITPSGILQDAALSINGDHIEAVGNDLADSDNTLRIDAKGKYLSPGFIDLHVHGGGGYDFMDGHEQAFLAIAETHARYGTTAMLPTTLSCSPEALYKTLDLYRGANKKNTRGAQFLGMHLEGPYFSLNQCGAQDPRYIRNPDPEEYTKILEYGDMIRRWSAAPELPGAITFAKYAHRKGVLMSMGHTDAIYEEALEGFENGYTLATHLYSGMSGVHRKNAYRYAGVIEAAFLIDDMDVEIIADGIHLPSPLLKLVHKIKGPARTALITDAMRAAGMPPGESVLGNINEGLKVIVEQGVAKLPDRSAFAGSVATADRLVRTMITQAGISLLEAVQMMTSTPASILGILDRKGSLVAGKDADLLIFDEDIQIQMTMIKGQIVYEKK